MMAQRILFALAALVALTTPAAASEFTVPEITPAMVEAILTNKIGNADADGDGEYNLAEATNAMAALGIYDNFFWNHGYSISNAFNALNTGGGSTLTISELAGIVSDSNFAVYQSDIISLFTNGVAESPNLNALVPGPAVTESAGQVDVSYTIDIPPSQCMAACRQDQYMYFLSLTGVEWVDIIFRKVTTRRKLVGRKLATVTQVSVKLYAATVDAAEQVSALLPATPSDFAALPEFSSYTVSSISVEAKEQWDPPFSGLVTMLVILIFIGIFLCVIACVGAGKRRKAAGVDSQGCCKTGCCSYFGVKPWAFGEFVACVCILIGVMMMFSAIGTLQDALAGLADNLYALLNPSNPIPGTSDFSGGLPTETINTVLEQRSLLQYLRFAVMGPGLLAVIFLLLASACPCVPKKPGRFCCTKCLIALSHVFLMLAFVFYMIFTIIPLSLRYAPEEIQIQIRTFTAMCTSFPMMLEQKLQDGNDIVADLQAASIDTSEFDGPNGILTSLTELSGAVSGICTNSEAMFEGFNGVFLPGTVCLVAIGFALYINMTLCCAAGCCCAARAGGNKVADLSTA